MFINHFKALKSYSNHLYETWKALPKNDCSAKTVFGASFTTAFKNFAVYQISNAVMRQLWVLVVVLETNSTGE